jgi:hypothetical protein
LQSFIFAILVPHAEPSIAASAIDETDNIVCPRFLSYRYYKSVSFLLQNYIITY